MNDSIVNPSEVLPTQPIARLLRIDQVLEIVPVSRSTWLNGIKAGRFPAGVKLGPKATFWRESDIAALIRSL